MDWKMAAKFSSLISIIATDEELGELGYVVFYSKWNHMFESDEYILDEDIKKQVREMYQFCFEKSDKMQEIAAGIVTATGCNLSLYNNLERAFNEALRADQPTQEQLSALHKSIVEMDKYVNLIPTLN